MKKYNVNFHGTENVLVEARSAYAAASKVFHAYMREQYELEKFRGWKPRKYRIKIESDLEEDGKTPKENIWKGNIEDQSWTYLYVSPA
jgi:hypothetical protein